MVKRYVIDIDGTLLYSTAKICEYCGRLKYENPVKNKRMIKKVNALYKKGAIIILWTGRGWDTYEETKRQINNAGILHHELVMGKPLGTYVDEEALTTL